ncbi:glycylpeptide N-tetradecanoyltransferase 2-like [Rhopilema esculentum]|uniref:glycylpeptide N-tetradecanoyltransferase 2-like n=1 Tax=Rhopilema esculentum TaxID=499914 RepID=UPI0031D0DE79
MADQKGSPSVSSDEKDGSSNAKKADDHTQNNQMTNQSQQGSSAGEGSSKKSSKKKKKGRKAESVASTGSASAEAGASRGSDGAPAAVNMQTLVQIQRAMEQLMATNKPARTPNEAKQRRYEFWDTQPVPRMDEDINEPVNEALEPEKVEIRQTPYSLPAGFVWDTLDIENPDTLKELYTLLNENYVEDDDNMFRFDYSPEFLKWALKPPGWKTEWHCGLRVESNKKLVGFISGVPANIRVYTHEQTMAEINFLCVHKKLRSKRMAPVLIKEITRRVNLEGSFQAVYTAGVVLPRPVATCRYWHRSLNPKKLIDVKFSHLSKNMTMQRTIRLYRLPEDTKTSGIRQLKKEDCSKAHKLLVENLKRFDLAPVFSEEEFRHWFMPQKDIIDCYVVENENGEITDMISFYTLPSTVMNHPSYNLLKAAYSFYNVSTKTPLVDLMNDALIIAKRNNFDVFNALDLMDNTDFLEKLKFGIGDGNLNYYLYNWKCMEMKPARVGLVLL